MEYWMRSHAVTGQRIVKVEPLIRGGQSIMSPDAGVGLVLESGKRHQYLAEPNVPMPVQGDYFIQDSELQLSFTMPASKFAELFSVNG